MVLKYFLYHTKNNSIVDNNVKKVDYVPEEKMTRLKSLKRLQSKFFCEIKMTIKYPKICASQ